MESIKLVMDATDRCPKCGRHVNVLDTGVYERDPLNAAKGRIYHPACYYQDHPEQTPRYAW